MHSNSAPERPCGCPDYFQDTCRRSRKPVRQVSSNYAFERSVTRWSWRAAGARTIFAPVARVSRLARPAQRGRLTAWPFHTRSPSEPVTLAAFAGRRVVPRPRGAAAKVLPRCAHRRARVRGRPSASWVCARRGGKVAFAPCQHRQSGPRGLTSTVASRQCCSLRLARVASTEPCAGAHGLTRRCTRHATAGCAGLRVRVNSNVRRPRSRVTCAFL